VFTLSGKKWDAATVYLINEGLQAFLFNMIFAVTMIYMVSTANLNPLQLVLVGTVLEGTIFVFEIPTGIVADVYSRRLSIIIGVLITGTSFLVMGAFPFFVPILLSQLIWGFGYTFTSGATSAWIVDEIGPEKAGPLFLRAAQVGNLAAIVGTLVAMGLGTLWLQLPILLGGALFIVLGLLLVLIMPEVGFKPAPSEDRSTWQQMGHVFQSGVGSVKGRPALVAILIISAISGASSEGIDRLSTAHFIRDIGFPLLAGLQPVHWLGAMTITSGLLVAGAARLVEKRLDTSNQRALIGSLAAVTLLRIGAIVWFALAPGFAAAVMAFAVMAITRRLREPLSEIWLNQEVDSSVRATVLSMNGQADALGQIALGPAVGWLGAARSIRAALLASGLALLPALVLYRRAPRRGKMVVTEEGPVS
jgi:DHA3 family tetracycline resistance protein-like MFS transporter